MNLASVIVHAWEDSLRDAPDDAGIWLFDMLCGRPKRTYRARLDHQPRILYGDLIPRITTVRGNLRLLGKPRRAPRLPV